MKGMQFLIQSKVSISRPDDFLAEMVKSDEHMGRIKSKILMQQTKIKTFEEKKLRDENKKFHKALKDTKMRQKHQEKKENLENINKLKKRIVEKGGDLEDDDFDKIMHGKKDPSKKRKIFDIVKEKQAQLRQKKKEAAFKKKTKGNAKGKRPKKGGKKR